MGVSSTSARSKLVETFYLEGGKTQYFIKPLMLKGENGAELLVDFTIRDLEASEDSAIVNFSITGRKSINELASFTLTSVENSISANTFERLYKKNSGDKYEARFSIKVPLDQLKGVFTSHEWEAVVASQAESFRFLPRGKTRKSIDEIQEKVFASTEQ